MLVARVGRPGAASAVRSGADVYQLLRVLGGRVHPHQRIQAALPRECESSVGVGCIWAGGSRVGVGVSTRARVYTGAEHAVSAV